MGYFFLDCEASSLNDGSFPIEIAWVAESGQSESYLIKPEPHWTDWSAKSESIHKISYASLHRDGTPARMVALRAASVLADHTIVSDNPTWDAPWLALLLQTIGHPALPVIPLDHVLNMQLQRLTALNTELPMSPAYHREMRRILDDGQNWIGDAQYAAMVVQTTLHRARPDAERLWRWWHIVKDKIDVKIGG